MLLNKWVIINYFSYFSAKTYVVGIQQNHLNETQNKMLISKIGKYSQFYNKIIV